MSAPGRSKYIPERPQENELFDVSSSYRAHREDVPKVRTLKPPPEIWELVHPVAPPKRSPVMTLINRVTSNGTILMSLIFAALAIGGLSAFLIVRPDKMEAKTSSKTANEKRLQPTQSAPTNTAPAALPDNQAQVVEKAVGVETPDANRASVSPAPESSTTNLESLSTTPGPTERKKIKVAPPKSLPASEYAVAERVSGNAAESQPVMDRTAEKKKSLEATTTKAKSNPNAPLIAPAKSSESPKAKVIQWP